MKSDFLNRFRLNHPTTVLHDSGLQPPPKPRRDYNILGGYRPSLFKKIKLFFIVKHTLKNPSMIAKLKSRKFLAAIVGGIIVITGNHLGISEAVTGQIATIVVGYILGQGAVDVATAIKAQ